MRLLANLGPSPGSKANPLRVIHVKQHTCNKRGCDVEAVWQLGARALDVNRLVALSARLAVYVCDGHRDVAPGDVFTAENWTRTVAAILARGRPEPDRATLEITLHPRSEWMEV